MTHNPSRKEFCAKLVGVVAAAGVLPKMSGQPASGVVAAPSASTGRAPTRRIDVRHDVRAVARRDTL